MQLNIDFNDPFGCPFPLDKNLSLSSRYYR